jgi:hypothetical protein
MRKFHCFVLSVLLLAAGSMLFGADFWESKSYDKWSQKECSKLLESSPWAQDFTIMNQGLQQSAKTSDDGQQFFVKYQVQFRSAQPVRQALVRQMLIAQKYDSLSPEQKQQLDQQANKILGAKFPDSVIVYVTYDANSQTTSRELARYWQSQTLDLLKNSIFLRNSSGDQVALVQFGVSQGAEHSFQLVFPRQVNGKPLVNPDDKSLMLQFTYPVVSVPGSTTGATLGDGKGYMEFKPKKMVFQGNLDY